MHSSMFDSYLQFHVALSCKELLLVGNLKHVTGHTNKLEDKRDTGVSMDGIDLVSQIRKNKDINCFCRS